MGVGVLNLAHHVADRIGRHPAFGQGRAVGDGLDRQLGQGRFHEAAPDGGGGRAARHAAHGLVVVLADPDGGDEAAGVADEPGVLVVRGRAGLAGDVAPADGGGTAAARGDHAAQHLVHIVERRVVDRLAVLARAVLIDDAARGGADAADAIGLDPLAAVGEGVIGLGHLQRADLDGAQGHGGLQADLARDAQTTRGAGHAVAADLIGDIGGHRIGRLGHRLRQCHLTGEVAGIVARRPAADGHGLVHDRGRRGVAGLDRRQIDKGFPRRASLTASVGRAVELAVGIGAAADHGADPAFPVQGDQSGLFDAPALVAVQDAAHGALGVGLKRQVQGGLDHHVFGRLADQTADLLVQPVDEVLGVLAGQGARDADRLSHGGVALGRCNGAGLDHLVQDDIGAGRGALALGHGRIARRSLQQTGQQGGFADRQLVRALVEIALRCGLDAISAGAEVDPVQIEGEDLFLGEFQLQPDGQHQLLHLALQVLIGGQEQVFGQLLGDGRAALDDASGLEIQGHGPAHADGVEAGVVIETPVLDGDEGGGHIVGQGVQIDRRGHLGAAHRNQGAGAVQVGDRGLAIDVIEGRGVGQVAREDREEDHGEDQAPDGQNRAPIEEVAEEGPTRLLAAVLLIAVRSAVSTRHESPLCQRRDPRAKSVGTRQRPNSDIRAGKMPGRAAAENAALFNHESVRAYFAERKASRSP